MLMNILKAIMGIKIGVGIWIGVGIFVLLLLINIFKGTFSIAKFAGGFNVFGEGVMGKLMYYLIIGAIVAAIALGIYAKFVQPTQETNYKNLIKNNENVAIDQRTINPVKEDLFCLFKIFGVKILSIEGGIKSETKITNKTKENKVLTMPKEPLPIGYASQVK